MSEVGETACATDKPEIVGTTAAIECWYARGRVFDHPIDWLVDTGSSHSVIDNGYYTRLAGGREISMKESNTLLRAADGNTMKVTGEIRLELSLAGHTFDIPVIVAELGGLQGILGLEFLSSQGFLVDVTQGKLLGKQFEISLYKARNLCTNMLSGDVEAPPFSGKVDRDEMDVNSIGGTNEIATIEPNKGELEKAGLIMMPRSPSKTDQGSEDGKGLRLGTQCSAAEAVSSMSEDEHSQTRGSCEGIEDAWEAIGVPPTKKSQRVPFKYRPSSPGLMDRRGQG